MVRYARRIDVRLRVEDQQCSEAGVSANAVVRF